MRSPLLVARQKTPARRSRDVGHYVDALKFAGGSFGLVPRKSLVELISLCYEHCVLVSTEQFI